jgi:hypothetical protein
MQVPNLHVTRVTLHRGLFLCAHISSRLNKVSTTTLKSVEIVGMATPF